MNMNKVHENILRSLFEAELYADEDLPCSADNKRMWAMYVLWRMTNNSIHTDNLTQYSNTIECMLNVANAYGWETRYNKLMENE